MVFKMGDFILGMGKEFALEAMQISNKLTMEDGEIINSLLKILQKNSANEALPFKRLAEMLGNRLCELYPSIS